MSGRFRVIADDYALSPGVGEGIRQLLAAGRLSGAGCMTLFPEWPDEARRLNAVPGLETADIGLHLTLTDFQALSGFAIGSKGGPMPDLKALIAATSASRRHDGAIRNELDAQLSAFRKEWGTMPAYIDGHQHVHFLRPVRQWLGERAALFAQSGRLPWLRGAPSVSLVTGAALTAKVSFVALLARGFNVRMRQAGYPIEGPLAGFYDWTKPENFAPALRHWQRTLPSHALVMCHPGLVDHVLRGRDSLVDAREAEFNALLAGPALALRTLS